MFMNHSTAYALLSCLYAGSCFGLDKTCLAAVAALLYAILARMEH